MRKYFHKTPKWITWLYPNLIWKGDRSNKSVYLTFDDGPTGPLTEWILDNLSVYNYKATFFGVGENIVKFPELCTEIANQGHDLANHTHNHLNGWNSRPENYFGNVKKCEEQVLNYSNSNLFRPPYGKISRKQIGGIMNMGYRIIMWDVLSGDFDTTLKPEKCLSRLMINTESGSIVVFHDNLKCESTLKEVLPQYLYFLNSKGFHTALWK